MTVPLIAGIDGFWITPGEARAEEDNVNAAVRALDADIASSMASASFRQAWALWKAEWSKFYASQGGVTGWLDRFMTAGGYDKAGEYRQQLEQWRQKFALEGGQPSAPSIQTQGSTGRPPATQPIADTAKYVMWTAGILAALWVASTIYRETKGRV